MVTQSVSDQTPCQRRMVATSRTRLRAQSMVLLVGLSSPGLEERNVSAEI